MTVAVASPVRVGTRQRSVVGWLTARKAVRSGVLWGYVFGISIAASALTYSRLYKTRADRQHLAATYGTNKAIAALFGPAPHLDTPAGFTSFKVGMTLMILASVWGLLTSTRLLRGEEEAGRWELLLLGGSTRSGAALQALAGLAAGATSLWLVTGILTALAGHSSNVGIGTGDALFFAAAMVSPAVMFLAVGSLTSQLGTTRRQAASYAAVVLGASYALRMVADAGIGLHWLVWASPLGWVEELDALNSPDAWPFLLVVALAMVAAGTAVAMAGRRDVGAGMWPDRTHGRAHVRLLSNQLGLTVRLVRPVVVAWLVALAITGVILGLVAKGAGGTLSGSAREVLEKLGASGVGVKLYLGVAYLIVAVLVAFVAAGQVTAARTEETVGHLEHLLVRPVPRVAWFSGRIGVALVVLISCGVVAGLFTFAGTATQHADVSLGSLLGAGLNVVPPSVLVFGIGALALGARPRVASIAAYAVLGWSLLVDVIGGFGSGGHWLLDTSIFHQMSAAPAVAPDLVSGSVMAGLGLLACLVGGFLFHRRDLAGD